MLSDRIRVRYEEVIGPVEDPWTFTTTYVTSQETLDRKMSIKTSQLITVPRDIKLQLDWPNDDDLNKFIALERNGVRDDYTRYVTASPPIQFYQGDTFKIRLLSSYTLGTKTFNFSFKENSLTGPTVYVDSVVVDKVAGGGCYLTSAMVDHYELDDNGVELTALRTLREKFGEKHKEMMKKYEKDSVLIIEGIEHSKNPEAYYHFIRQEVNQIVGYAQKEKWTLAEQVYLDLYLDLKELFLDNRGGFKWN